MLPWKVFLRSNRLGLFHMIGILSLCSTLLNPIFVCLFRLCLYLFCIFICFSLYLFIFILYSLLANNMSVCLSRLSRGFYWIVSFSLQPVIHLPSPTSSAQMKRSESDVDDINDPSSVGKWWKWIWSWWQTHYNDNINFGLNATCK